MAPLDMAMVLAAEDMAVADRVASRFIYKIRPQLWRVPLLEDNREMDGQVQES